MKISTKIMKKRSIIVGMDEEIVKVRKPKVWKIGSRWSYDGNPETSIYSIFEKNNVVFVGHKGDEFKDNVRIDDYFAIADGYKIVAVAKAISKPMELDLLFSNLERNAKENDVFSYEKNKKRIGCRVILFPLGEKEFDYKKRGSFHAANKYWTLIKSLYEDFAKERINNTDLKFYNVREQEKLNWLPWIGDNFFLSERKVLLIGESHYMTPKYNSFNYTREVVLRNGVEDTKDKQPFFRNVRYCLLNSKQKSVKETFWNTVSFYNFVQRPMDNLHKRPTEDDYKKGWNSFQEVIKILQPTDIIFFGREALGYCPKNVLTKKELRKVGNNKVYELHFVNNDYRDIKIFGVKHPSAFFSWKKWFSFFNEYDAEVTEYLRKICKL